MAATTSIISCSLIVLNQTIYFSLTNRAEVELSLDISDFPANISLASEHAAELIDIVYRMDDDIVDDDDFIKGHTEVSNSQNIVDQVLIEYGKADGYKI